MICLDIRQAAVAAVDLVCDFAPLRRDGRLPPSITAQMLKQAYDLQNLGAAHVLGVIGWPRAPGTAATRLRNALDQVRIRDVLRRKGANYPLHNVLYQFFRAPSWPQAVIERCLIPALITRDGRTFLDPDVFDVRLDSEFAEQPPIQKLTEPNRALAGAALAFGLLQPEEAVAIVGSLVRHGSAFAEFFGTTTTVESSSFTPKRDVPSAKPEAHEPKPQLKTALAGVEVGAPPITRFQSSVDVVDEEVLAGVRRAVGVVIGAAQQLNTGRTFAEKAKAATLADAEYRSLVAEVEDLRSLFDPSIRLPGEQELTTQDAAAEWLTEVNSVVSHALQAQRQLSQFRSEAERKFSTVGLEIPFELRQATSTRAVDEVLQTYQGLLLEASLRALVVDAERPQVLADLAPTRRMQVYAEVSSGAASPLATIEWLLLDCAACQSNPQMAAETLCRLSLKVLASEEALPAGVWKLISQLDKDLLARRMQGDLDDWIQLNSHANTNSEELIEALGDAFHGLNSALRMYLAKARLARLPVNERLRETASMAIRSPRDPELISEVVRLLGASNQVNLAWLVADAAARVLDVNGLAASGREAFLLQIARSAASNTPYKSTIDLLSDHDAWLIGDLDALTIALFAAARVGAGPDVFYRHQRDVEFLRARRPALLSLWIEPKLHGRIPSCRDPAIAALWTESHDTAVAWHRDMQKRTCYQGWRYAEDYQRAIRQELYALVAGAPARIEAPVDGAGLVDAVQRERDLPPIENPARQLTIAFTDRQLERGRVIHSALVRFGTTLEILLKEAHPPFAERLRVECGADQPEAISIIYDFVVGEVLAN